MYRFYRFMYGFVGFSRSQTNGFVLLLPLVFGVIYAPFGYRLLVESKVSDHSDDVRQLEILVAQLELSEVKKSFADPTFAIEPFDPNTTSQADFERLGISSAVARRIVNFVSKGGRFREKEDLLKIYGFDSVLYKKLEPKITIARRSPNPFSAQRKFTLKANQELRDLNEADTSQLKQLKGIGEKLSVRIVKYREALGGFVSFKQLREIYHLDTMAIKKIEFSFFIKKDFVPKKINVNTAERQILSIHPYISDKAASAIVAYRFQHGEFKSLEDLRKIPLVDSVMLRKTLPYLKLVD